MPWNLILPLLIVAAFAGWLVWMRRHYKAGANSKPSGFRSNMLIGSANSLGWLRKQWYRFLDWWHRLMERWAHHQDRPRGPGPDAPATPSAPAPRRPAGPGRSAPADPGAPIPLDVTPAEIPPSYGPLLAFISGFEATEDADLMAFTRGMAAGDLATADALHAQLEHCLAEIGLDPASVQGLADYAEQRAEHAQGAMQIWQRFATVYAEVQAFVASGGVLPKDGRWLTGEG